MYICDTMNLNLLENILCMFYGTKAQCLHFLTPKINFHTLKCLLYSVFFSK